MFYTYAMIKSLLNLEVERICIEQKKVFSSGNIFFSIVKYGFRNRRGDSVDWIASSFYSFI